MNMKRETYNRQHSVSIRLYTSLIRLQYNNNMLLKVYQEIFKDPQQKGSTFSRKAVERIRYRESFRRELMLLKDKLSRSNHHLLQEAYAAVVPGVYRLSTFIDENIKSFTPDECFESELNNLEQYYKTLNIPEADWETRKILEKQKLKIENYLMKQL